MIDESQIRNRFFYVIKDKDNQLHQVVQRPGLSTDDIDSVWTLTKHSTDVSKFTGFENELLHCTAYNIEGSGHGIFGFTTTTRFNEDARIYVLDDAYPEEDNRHVVFDISPGGKSAQEFCDEINTLDSDHSWLHAYYYESNGAYYVCLRLISSGEQRLFHMYCNPSFLSTVTIVGSNTITSFQIDITGDSDSDSDSDSDTTEIFEISLVGGCQPGMRLRIPATEVGLFDVDPSTDRYIKTTGGYCKVAGWTMYVDTEGVLAEERNMHFNNVTSIDTLIEDTEYRYDNHRELSLYSEVILQEPADVVITRANQIELYDRYRPTVGQLSFFPVKDFYFNMYNTEYGFNQAFGRELRKMADDYRIYDKNYISKLDIVCDSGKIIGSNDGSNDVVTAYIKFNNYDGLDVENYSVTFGKSLGKYSETFTGTTSPIHWPENPLVPDITRYLSSAVNLKIDDIFSIQLTQLSGNLKLVVDSENTNNIENYFTPYNLFDSTDSPIYTEYEYYMENQMSDLSFVNKTVPSINAWSYLDNALDSYEHPYRLNISKVFRYNNLSANTQVNDCSLYDSTHEVPYILTSFLQSFDSISADNYQYVDPSDYFKNTGESDDVDYLRFTVADWISEFENCVPQDVSNPNLFDTLFDQHAANKMYNKKYSTFRHISSNGVAETLFRGVKFQVTDVQVDYKTGNYVNVQSNRFDGWKFTSVMIPLYHQKYPFDSNYVYVVMNDACKFIVVATFFNTLYQYDLGRFSSPVTSLFTNTITGYGQFTKTYIYSSAYGIIRMPYITNINLLPSIMDGQRVLPATLDGLEFLQYFEQSLDSLVDGTAHTLTPSDPTVRVLLFNTCVVSSDESDSNTFIELEFEDGSIIDIPYLCDGHSITIPGIQSAVRPVGITFLIPVGYEDDGDSDGDINSTYRLFSNYYIQLKHKNAFNIKYAINSGDHVVYSGRDTDDVSIVTVVEPQEVTTYNFFRPNLEQATSNKYSMDMSTVKDITIVQNNRPSLETLARYSGYYEPASQDILLFTDVSRLDGDIRNEVLQAPGANLYINNEFPGDQNHDFATIRGIHYHKYLASNSISFTGDTKYPLLTTYPISHRDMNIFESNWDPKYYIKQSELSKCAADYGTRCMKEQPAFFGSKILKLPNEITIETFGNTAIPYNIQYLNNPENIPGQYVMYEELTNQDVNLYVLLHSRLVDYFIQNEVLMKEFAAYVKPLYSYNDINEIRDDVAAYVELNVLHRYELTGMRFWVKPEPQVRNNSIINNDYNIGLSLNDGDKIAAGFEIQKAYSDEAVGNTFNRKISYRMKDGWKESFGYSCTLKLI